ncbi:LmeA family phospholipid-binding protein [Gordonia sp. (in: high G+C Gram-positive bacteria)]|uniref:LmeA family phospholipid-binding protein n=1 Tax=Gordonia sp. (in: high G+C Gram-positive bacteria) TaxID=84139 RepID=UPI003C76461D
MTDEQRPPQPDDDASNIDDPTVPHAEPAEAVEPAEPAPATDPEASVPEPSLPEAETVPDDAGSSIDETPTGEVITGPIRNIPGPQTQAYSQAGNPPTKQMEALDSSAFEPIPPVNAGPPGPPTSPGAVRTSPSKKRPRGRTIGLVALAVVLALIIAGVGTELYMRHKVTNCLQTSFENLTGASTDVSVSRSPIVFSVVSGEVPWVQVDTTDGSSSTMRLHARAEGISTDGGTVKALGGNGYLPYERITALSSDTGGGQSPIQKISADKSAGTLKIETTVNFTIIPVPVTVTLKPVLKDGAVTFEVKEATALIFGIGTDFAQPIVDQVTASMFGPLFKQIQVTKLDVGTDGIDFAFQGKDVNLKSAAESTGGQGGNSCSM